MAIRLSLPPGPHSISLQVSDDWAGQWLRSQLLEVDQGQRTAVFSQTENTGNYFVARKNQPLMIKVQGPTLLRIDQLQLSDDRNGDIRHSYRQVSAGVHTLALKPAAGDAQGLFRVYQQVLTEPQLERMALIYRRDGQYPLLTWRPEQNQEVTDPRRTSENTSVWPQVGQLLADAPTVSVLAGYEWLVENDENQDDQRFDLAVQRRVYDRNDHYQFYELRLSQDNHSQDQLLQLKGQWQWQTEQRQDRYYDPLSAFERLQPEKVELKAQTALQEQYISGYGEVSGRWQFTQPEGRYYQKADWAHWLDVSTFYYLLPPKETVTRPLSDRLWSQYKDSHSFGIKLSDQWRYQWDINHQLAFGSQLKTNTDGSLDQLGIQVGGWQQNGSWQWGLRYLPTYRFQDHHRDVASWQQQLQIDFNKDLVGSTRSRWQLMGVLGLDLDSKQPYGSLNLIRHQSDGDLFDDFPSQRFKQLRISHLTATTSAQSDAKGAQ